MSIFPRKVRQGDHLVVDDRTGFTVWASKTIREALTGYRVERGRNDPRHPQEFLRTKADKQTVRDPRPPGTANYAGPLITYTSAAADAYAQDIVVESAARYLVSDRIRIQISNGDFFPATVLGIVGTTVSIVEHLPEDVASGATVINLSANGEVEY